MLLNIPSLPTDRWGIYLLHTHPNAGICVNLELSFLVSTLTKAENLSPSLRHPLCPFPCKGERVPNHHKKKLYKESCERRSQRGRSWTGWRRRGCVGGLLRGRDAGGTALAPAVHWDSVAMWSFISSLRLVEKPVGNV